MKAKKLKFKIETARTMLKDARDDIYAAEVLATAPHSRPETIMYHVQQCIEKSIKAFTIHCNQAVFLTHDIDVLLSDLAEQEIAMLPHGVGELTQYATVRRYLDGDELIEKSDLLNAIKTGHVFIEWAALKIES